MKFLNFVSLPVNFLITSISLKFKKIYFIFEFIFIYIYILFLGFYFYSLNLFIFLSDFPFIPRSKKYKNIKILRFYILKYTNILIFPFWDFKITQNLIYFDLLFLQKAFIFYVHCKYYKLTISLTNSITILFPLFCYFQHYNKFLVQYFIKFYMFISKKLFSLIDRILW